MKEVFREYLFEYANWKNIIIYFLVVNFIGFVAMGLDKRKAQKGKWRTPEATLMGLCLIGGGIGTIWGMYLFRHKTKKLKFSVGMPTILIAEIVFVIYILFF